MRYEFRGTEELAADFDRAVQEYPYEAEAALNRVGNKFRRSVIEKTPITEKEHKNKLKKSFKKKIVGYGNDIEWQLQNKAPHFHLIERGHKLVNHKGEAIGFIPGKHMVESTAQEFESIVPDEMKKMLRKVTQNL